MIQINKDIFSNNYFERLLKAFAITGKKFQLLLTEEEVGLTDPQFFILFLLSEKGKCTVTEIAEEMQVNPSAITVMINRLVKNEMVLRERDVADRRVVYIQLSPIGLEAFKQTSNKRNEIMQRYLSHLEDTEIEALLTIYEKLANIQVKSKKKK